MTDPTNYAELHEFAESVQIELDAIRMHIFDHASAVRLAGVHQLVGIGDELMVQYRKLTNIVENLAELLDARPVPAVLQFEEVDG